MGSLSLLQGIFSTQGSNPGLPHCGWILYQLSHQGSPRILEWGAYPFSSGSSWATNQTRVSCTAVDSLQTAIREASVFCQVQYKMNKKNIFLFLETVTPRSSPVSALFNLRMNFHLFLRFIYLWLDDNCFTILYWLGFPHGAVVKNLSANAGDARDVCLIPGSGRSPGWGNGNPFQYSCLENSVGRGAWWVTVRGFAKSQTRQSTQHNNSTPRHESALGIHMRIWTLLIPYLSNLEQGIRVLDFKWACPDCFWPWDGKNIK